MKKHLLSVLLWVCWFACRGGRLHEQLSLAWPNARGPVTDWPTLEAVLRAHGWSAEP